MHYEIRDAGNGMQEWHTVADEQICPACGQAIDYCQGHGDIGDTAGYGILEMHDTGNHTECHPNSDCRNYGETWSEARKRFNDSLDENYGMVEIAGLHGYSTSRILASIDPARYRQAFNDWAGANGVDTDSLIGPVDMPSA